MKTTMRTKKAVCTPDEARKYEAEISEVKYFLAQFGPKDQKSYLALFRNVDKYVHLLLPNSTKIQRQTHCVKLVKEQLKNQFSDAGNLTKTALKMLS